VLDQHKIQSYRVVEGVTSSLNFSKKSSVISNQKMDFIDPGRTGTGMISSRNSRVGNGANDLCQRFVELPAGGKTVQTRKPRYAQNDKRPKATTGN